MPATYRPARYATAARHAFSEPGDASATSPSEQPVQTMLGGNVSTRAVTSSRQLPGVFPPSHIPEMWECEKTPAGRQ